MLSFCPSESDMVQKWSWFLNCKYCLQLEYNDIFYGYSGFHGQKSLIFFRQYLQKRPLCYAAHQDEEIVLCWSTWLIISEIIRLFAFCTAIFFRPPRMFSQPKVQKIQPTTWVDFSLPLFFFQDNILSPFSILSH